MSFEIITDSSANLSDEMIETYGLHILSLVYRLNGEEYPSYQKGVHIDLAEYYRKLREKQEITTSLINLEECSELLTDLLEQGKDVLYIGFSSGLSGSSQAVTMMMNDLREQYPNQKIYAVDTLAAAMGEGFIVLKAAQMKKEGKGIDEVRDWITEHKYQVCHWFTVDDLFFLHRGGRVSKTSAVLGSMLSIKPVLHVDDEGHLILMEKARGRRKSLDALCTHMEETALDPENGYVFITHGDCLEDAQYLADRIKQRLHTKHVVIEFLEPVVGAHAGPGTVALFYLGTKR